MPDLTSRAHGGRMATADVAWLHMDRPTNLMVVNCVFWFERPLDWEAVAAAFAQRLVPAFPHFAQRVVEPVVTVGAVGPRWERVPGFDVGDHLHRVTLPEPGGEEQLHAYVSSQAHVPLDPARPLWQAHLVDGHGSGSAILLRTHHALADGTTLVQALLTLVDPPEQPDAPHPGQRPLRREEEPTSWLESAGRRTTQLAGPLLGSWWTGLTEPRRALAAARSWPATTQVLTRLGFAETDQPTRLRGALSGAKHLTWAGALPLTDLKATGRRLGATVNDLALTAIAGALRSYLAEHGEAVERLTAVVPVNLRPVDQLFEPDQGNQFGLAFVRLPVGEPDAGRRLASVREAMQRVKTTDEAVVVYEALAVVGQTPKQLEQAWLDLFTGRASVVVTNVAGPPAPVALAGVPLVGFTAWVPSTGPIGLGLSICSYAGDVVLGVAADTALVPDTDRLLRAIEAEFRALPALQP